MEMIYAVLPSWGMHRMGTTAKAKVCSFDDFQNSIMSEDVRKIIDELKIIDDDLRKIKSIEGRNEATIHKIDRNVIRNVAAIIPKIKASISESPLVAASKTLCHILPHIVPPIDRQYSLRFMKKNKNINRDVERLAEIFIAGMVDFFKSNSWKESLKNIVLVEPKIPVCEEYGAFNTSLPKIYDNLIVAYFRKSS